ncbi:DUF1194 domain-containing protein [Mesorhizobium sp. M1272]|uniref:DUF1194 domain-containing protein n=1 Tax=Mesorhizobium sp. M1272 TaxID=2957074 RepID=UPI003336B1B5
METLSSSVLTAWLFGILVIADQPIHDGSFGVNEKRFLDESMVVDVAIVLAADVSGSISQSEANLQRESYAAALESTAVLKMIKSGRHGKIVVTFIEWSSFGSLETRLDWAILSDANDAGIIAATIRKKSDRLGPGPHGAKTSISYAIDASVKALQNLPVPASRLVIDISGDGANNDGSSLEDSRQRAIHKDIVINGLPIGAEVENGETTPEYYERHVIGGPGSFVIPADGLAEFQWAILNKLVREVGSIPVLTSGAVL